MAVELVADRFFERWSGRSSRRRCERRRRARAGTCRLWIARAGERAATAPPAPPEGLIFAGVGYGKSPGLGRRGRN